MPRRPLALNEFQLIDRIRAAAGRIPPEVTVGIGDDAAVVRHTGRGDWVFTTDLLAEGIHFALDTTSFADLGFKAGAANLSDLAAMGSRPRYLLVNLALPATLDRRHVLALYRGLSEVSRPYGVAVIGGDTSASVSGLFLAITAIGRTTGKPAIRRKGARVGDLLFVSGTIGDSLAGLRLLQQPPPSPPPPTGLSRAEHRHLLARHRRPTPRIELGLALARRGLASAMLDLSDGLSADLPHLCEQSGVGAVVDAARLPLSRALQAFSRTTGQSPIDLALQGGEDYELLFTTRPAHRQAVAAVSRHLGLVLTEVGRILPKRAGRRLRQLDGTETPMPMTGYRHFQSRSDGRR